MELSLKKQQGGKWGEDKENGWDKNNFPDNLFFILILPIFIMNIIADVIMRVCIFPGETGEDCDGSKI